MSQQPSHRESTTPLVRDARGEYRPANADEVLTAARQVIGRRVRRGTTMSSPQAVRDFLRTKLAELEHELFVALLLDSPHRLIEYAELFRGTLAQTSVYPIGTAGRPRARSFHRRRRRHPFILRMWTYLKCGARRPARLQAPVFATTTPHKFCH